MADKSRRDFIKNTFVGTSIIALAKNARAEEETKRREQEIYQPQRPVTAITLGAGNRGNVYGNYATANPEQLNIVGVAEPLEIRNQRYADKHLIPKQRRFQTWEEVFQQPKFADAVIVSTPDDLHFGPTMAALELGYDVLLEKPVSPSLEECLAIRDKAQENNRIVAVCHVLRYSPYFRELHAMLRAGAVGELVSMQHLEPIQFEHMAHSYVRGNWHNADATTPIILAKSCHDLDILRWLADEPCQQISAFGDLKWFTLVNAPEGSTERCLDGCRVEQDCPYSARKLYLDKSRWSYVFDLPEDPERTEMERLFAAHPRLAANIRRAFTTSANFGAGLARLQESNATQTKSVWG